MPEIDLLRRPEVNIFVGVGIIFLVGGLIVLLISLTYLCDGNLSECGLCKVPIMRWGGISGIIFGLVLIGVGVC